jgi:hypothetical protein
MFMAASKSQKKVIQPSSGRKRAKVSDKALPAKKAGAVKGGLLRKAGDDPIP